MIRLTPGSAAKAAGSPVLEAKPRQNTPSARSTSMAGKPRDLKPIKRHEYGKDASQLTAKCLQPKQLGPRLGAGGSLGADEVVMPNGS
jgi:hypothetical protein